MSTKIISITSLLKNPQDIQSMASQGYSFDAFSRSQLVFTIIPPKQKKIQKTAKNLLNFASKNSAKKNIRTGREKMTPKEEKLFIRREKSSKHINA